MGNSDILNQYINGVLKNTKTKRVGSLSDVYQSLYNEDTQQELPGIAPGSGEDESEHVAVFYINKNNLTEEVVAQFRQVGGEGPIHVPISYFNKIERRFRGKTIEHLAHEWLKVSTKGNKVDNLAYESLLNKLFDSDIKGAEDLIELRDVVNWCMNKQSNYNQPDIIHQALAVDQVQGINFADLLNPIVSFFIAGDPLQFLFKLWNITEQAKGIGVGKGEIAISLLSRGYKGEPGDVKFDANEDGSYLDIEVKGAGGRPGKKAVTHGFGKKVENLIPDNFVLNDATVRDIQQKLHGGDLNQRIFEIKSWFEDTLRNRHMTSADKSITMNKSGDIITTFLLNLETLVYDNKYKDVNDVIKHIQKYFVPVQEMIDQYNEQSEKRPVGLPQKYLQRLFGKGTGGIALFIYTHQQYSNIKFMKNLNWREAVTFFFMNAAPAANLTESVVAEALFNLRTDITKQDAALQTAIERLLINEGLEVVYNKETLEKLVAAVQFTSYCSADGFNRALFINDGNLNARSVPTDPNNPDITLNNLYSEFVSQDYIISMNVDSRSKGVQITFNG